MKNAHLRFGWLTYVKVTEKTTTSIKLRLDRFIGELLPDPPRQAKAHLISVIGGDTQIAAISAAISLGDRFMVEGPGVPPVRVCLERNAQVYKGAIQVNGRQRPFRHLIGLSEELASASSTATSGKTLAAGSVGQFVWTAVAHLHGIPGVPEWGNWFIEELKTHHVIVPALGIGCAPAVIKATKEQFLAWLSWGVESDAVRLPDKTGPVHWPMFNLKDIFSPPSRNFFLTFLSLRFVSCPVLHTRGSMAELSTIYDYMRSHAAILGQRILQEYPALQRFEDPVSAKLQELLRQPFPAQAIAIMGLAKRWQQARTAMVVAECGTGKTLISLGGIHVHCSGGPFTALAMVPPHLVEKWAREAFLTLAGIRVFMIDDFRNGGDENKAHGINEVRLRKGSIVREGLHTTLSELRLRRDSPNSRQRWMSLCGSSSLFIVGRERAKLGYFWRHAYQVPRSGPYMGSVVNPDTGRPVVVESGRLTAADFEAIKLAETLEKRGDKAGRLLHSPLWQADSDKIRRMAPIEFIGRYMPDWFDYAICDEVHQLAGDTAQGNALGTLAACANRIVGLTGTLLGGFADDLFNTLFRLEAGKMKEHGYEWGATGRSSFTQDYGVLETITKVEPANNRCSKAKTTSAVRRKPGASPLLFGEFLMQLCAFVFLEDISDELPPYEESYVSVPMDEDMRDAYGALEDEIRQALNKHRGNRSVLSTMLNTLLLYPDHPYGLGTLYGTEFDGEVKRKVRFVIAETRNLPQDRLHSKERRLIQEIRMELAEGRRCQVFAVYTHKHDVTARLQCILSNDGIRSAVLRASMDTSKREAWYSRQVKSGVQVVICHPKLVETGLDLLDFPTIIFYESGYSLHTLRQASRRSWRIGQSRPVRVKFMCQEGTMQTACLRHMGKKLLVALTMEGKFAGEGLQTIDEDDDMLSAMARELVERNGIGETADAVWKTLNAEHHKLFPAPVGRDDDTFVANTDGIMMQSQSDPASLVDSVFDNSAVVFGERKEPWARKRRRREAVIPGQGSLFSLS